MADLEERVVAAVRSRSSRRGREAEYVLGLYRTDHPEEEGEPIAPERVAEWAAKRGVWIPPPINPVNLLRKQIATYLRAARMIDPQGREVRANAAVFVEVGTSEGPKKRSRWLPLFDAPAAFAWQWFQLRRKQSVDDLVQMETDRESYNDNNKHGAKLGQMELDFTKDVAEKKMPATYPVEAPDGFDDEDDDVL